MFGPRRESVNVHKSYQGAKSGAQPAFALPAAALDSNTVLIDSGADLTIHIHDCKGQNKSPSDCSCSQMFSQTSGVQTLPVSTHIPWNAPSVNLGCRRCASSVLSNLCQAAGEAQPTRTTRGKSFQNCG